MSKTFPMELDSKTNEIIVQTAKLFRQYGVRSVSVDDIARELGISKKTFYKYIANKEELIKLIMNYSFSRIKEKVEEVIQSKYNAIDALLEISKTVNEDVKLFTPTVSFDLKKYYPEIYNEHINRSKEWVMKAVTTNLKNGIKQGYYRKEINPDIVAALYVNKIEALHSSELCEKHEITFELIFETMFENHLRGIANKSGVEYFEKQKISYKF